MLAGQNVKLNNDVTLSGDPLTLDKDVESTVNLNGKAIDNSTSDVFVVTAGHLTIEGDGKVIASADNSSSAWAVWAKGYGKVPIKGGTYMCGDDESSKASGNWRNDCIYARDNATIIIEGGEFMYTGNNPDGHKFLLNVRDGSGAKIVVKGGTFHNFNPASTASENPVTSFVAEGFKSVETAVGSNIWEVIPE